MRTAAVVLAAVLAVGCGLPTEPDFATPESDKEAWASSETVRLSAKLHKSLTAQFAADTRHVPAGTGGCPPDANEGRGCDAAAWFDLNTHVVFWRAWVNRDAITKRDITDVAGHEVCHSVSVNHDALHYNCMLTLGTDPTYAAP